LINNSRTLMGAAAIAGMAFVAACGSEPQVPQDPIAAAPAHYSLVLENSAVRVLKINYAPGDKGALHNDRFHHRVGEIDPLARAGPPTSSPGPLAGSRLRSASARTALPSWKADAWDSLVRWAGPAAPGGGPAAHREVNNQARFGAQILTEAALGRWAALISAFWRTFP
jgi:hypothetical protein